MAHALPSQKQIYQRSQALVINLWPPCLLVSESGLLLSEGLLVVPLSLQLRVGVA